MFENSNSPTKCITLPPLGYKHVQNCAGFKFLLWNRLSNIHQISLGAFSQKGIDNLVEWLRAIEQDDSHAHIC